MNRVIKTIVISSVLCGGFASAPAWAIDCLSAPGDPKSGWYSWREIDGRKCWFKKSGAMPAKSELHWPTKIEDNLRPASSPPTNSAAPEEESVPAAPPAPTASAAEPVESKSATVPQFRTVRVKPVPIASARIGNNQVDLMNSGSLSAVQVFGVARPKARRPAPADAFDARFNGNGN